PFQDGTRDRAGRDTTDRLPARGPPASPVIAHPVLLPVCVVGVPGPEHILQVGVILGSSVHAPDDQRDRGPGRHAFEHARQDLHQVGFLALRRDRALAGAPAVEIPLYQLGGNRDPGRTAVQDHPDRRAVALTEGGDREEFSEGAAHLERGFLVRSLDSAWIILAATLYVRSRHA